MGSLEGHLIPGSMFILGAVWWFIGEILQNNRNNADRARRRATPRGSSPFVQPVWYSCRGARLSKLPVEPIVKVIVAVLSVICELLEYDQTALFDDNGEFVAEHLDNYAHSAMYAFFGLSGLVDLVMWYALLPLPPKFDYLVMSLAFWFEGFLFFFHLHGRDELNVRLHTILYIVVFVTAGVFLLAVISDQFMQFMSFLKPYLLCLQGGWFYQAGFVSFGPDPWKNSPSNVEFLGIAVAVHALAWFVVHLIFHIACYRCFIKKPLLNERRLSEESSGEEVDSVMLEEL
ncbi:Family of unknown function (DUF716) [Desmophyllum pertusum]|uniref:Transmembrane protein 45B n=1 Tax=Desmophyllum pertusum TaxID=174260 RepID=A0A9W9ZT79_9CNID|nr:Family of unknown function (DUF716) [Desmophyllum pertusum]